MSIEIRVVTLSRSFRSLIKNTRGMSKHIKDLKDLSVLPVASAIDIKVLRTLETFFGPERWRGTGPRPTVRDGVFCAFVNAGAFFSP